jgi:hypothetical protein
MAIRATVSVATLRASINITTENSLSASIPVIQASIYAELLEAGVHYISNNATGIWTDADSKNKFFKEEFVISDVQFNLFNKITVDSAAISDNDVLHVGLNKEDTAVLEDSDYKDVVKALVSVGITSEEQQVDFLKTLVDDTPFTSDVQKQTFNKFSVDSYTIADSDFKDFYKALVDSSQLTDTLDTIEFFKNTQDVVGFTDNETVAFAKFLFDNVNVTDDIDGAASILDDQEMQYHKVTTNLAAVTDVFFRMVAYSREFIDTPNFTDDETRSVGKTLIDSAQIADINTLASGKHSVDSSVFTDSTKHSFNKGLLDTSVFTDNETLSIGKSTVETVSGITDDETLATVKALVDASLTNDDHFVDFDKDLGENLASIADADYKAFNKALTDAPSLIDAIDTLSFFKNTQDAAGFTDIETLALVKVLSDVVGATDDIDGTASILDDQETQYFKNTINVANITDSVLLTAQFKRNFTDSASLFTETHNFNFGKLISDTPVVGDALALHMTLAPFNDSSSISDTVAIAPNKGILENSTSLTDTGSLKSQGYSDFTYFAEDYVGASRNF